MCEGDGRERDRALVSTVERYLGSSQERPGLLQDGFLAAVRLWLHYEGVVKAGCAAAADMDDRPDVEMIARLKDEIRVLNIRLNEARAAFERLKCSRNDWARTERDGLVVRNKSLEAELARLNDEERINWLERRCTYELQEKDNALKECQGWMEHAEKAEAELAEQRKASEVLDKALDRAHERYRDAKLRKARCAAASPDAGERSEMLKAVAAASLGLSRALSAFGDEERLLGAIRAIVAGGLDVHFTAASANLHIAGTVDVCVDGPGGVENNVALRVHAGAGEAVALLRRVERRVLEGVAEERAAAVQLD